MNVACIALIAMFGVQDTTTNSVQHCGADCLYVALAAFDRKLELSDVTDKLGPPAESGFSIAELKQVALELGFHAVPVETSLAELRRRSKPFVCLALTSPPGRDEHFAILASVVEGRIEMLGPPSSRMISESELNAIWDGRALLVSNVAIVDPRWNQLKTVIRNVFIAMVGLGALVFVYRRLMRAQ